MCGWMETICLKHTLRSIPDSNFISNSIQFDSTCANIENSSSQDFDLNIAKGTTDPGVDCFDQ